MFEPPPDWRERRFGPWRPGYAPFLDVPTQRILRRPQEPLGVWQNTGYLEVAGGGGVLPLYERPRDRPSRDLWDYQTVVDDVRVDLFRERRGRLRPGDLVVVPGSGGGEATVRFYEGFD